MLERIINPYRIRVSDRAREAGFEDQHFPNKKAAQEFVRRVRSVDPDFSPIVRLTFRYVDNATGELYATRLEYELEQERFRIWQNQQHEMKFNSTSKMTPKSDVKMK